MSGVLPEVAENIVCFHCGEDCDDDTIVIGEKYFCCNGCKTVYEILNENNLCCYYDLNSAPGNKQRNLTGKRFSFLDDVLIQQKLIHFKNRNEVRITFHIPAMHCSSCIWLLENFRKINDGVLSSDVNFLKKEMHLVFDEKKTSLRQIVEQLSQTGYEPELHLDSIEHKEIKKTNRSRIIRIGIAGFCFGNIMMLSFPEYFSSGKNIDASLRHFFSYLNLLLALPVFFYSASEFFIKSYRALKHKTTSIDIPIALGIAAIFIRSVYEIISQTGAGYFDSGSGLVFFMLIGRWFQDFTFDSLAFDRNYKSYFPIAVTSIKNGIEKNTAVNDLQVNDRILIRNNEIIPVDGLLLKGNATIDYHFVTGESVPVVQQAGETIFAGGKQLGSLIELQVTKEISQSYLTQLWNNNFLKSSESGFDKLVQAISKWFIAITLLIALVAGAYWWNVDVHKAVNAFTAVLVIACPCALALSAPFTYGNILRILGKKKIYLRNYQSLEKLADIDAIVFDKTGTLTENNSSEINFVGEPLSSEEEKLIYSLVRQSSHPLSKMLCSKLACKKLYSANDFNEIPGKGVSALINSNFVEAGSDDFISSGKNDENDNRTKVLISINHTCRGYFVFSNSYRKGLEKLISRLQPLDIQLTVLTGDNESEKENLQKIFPANAELLFDQSPQNKSQYIRALQLNGNKVLMIGDGLNDAGALHQSDVGISITENTNSFTPACDGICDAAQFQNIPVLLAYSKLAVKIIIISFIISLLYNFIGLSFAVTGTLSPMLAAILMPISTISLVLFTVMASTLRGKKLFDKNVLS